MRPTSTLPLLAAILALAPLNAGQTVHDVTTSGTNFEPAHITIQMGDTVRWTMAGPMHTVTDSPQLGAPLFDTPILPVGGVFEFTFDEAAITQSARPGGVYDYICVPHVSSGMIGSVTVTDIPLVADALFLSASAGGSVQYQLDGGAASAGLFHVFVGSASGISPGIPLDGLVLPLNYDEYMLFTLESAGGAVFSGTIGALDGNGHATCSVNVPAGQATGLIGKTFYHAWAGLDLGAGGTVEITSNPVPLFFGL